MASPVLSPSASHNQALLEPTPGSYRKEELVSLSSSSVQKFQLLEWFILSGSAGSLGLRLGPRFLCDFSESLILFVTFSQFICKKVWTKGFFLFKQNNNHKVPPANSKLHIKFQININGETGYDSFCIELSTKNTSLRIQ